MGDEAGRRRERLESELLRERIESAREQAVLVAVRFTTERARPGAQAKLARQAAELRARAALNAADTSEEADAPDYRGGGETRAESDEASLAEFRELARSAGATEAALLVQQRQKADPATLVGGGKLEEIVATVAATGASLVLFDQDLTPSQARNIEARLPCTVIDRTQLILDIFARHARTREGQLQVELAQLEYQLPRLGGRGKTMSQTGGGIGTRGPGETQLETDRRKINRRMVLLKAQLERVRRTRALQRGRREAVPVPTVALVGYTNAGKSTLFNALTGASVLESRQMFATLDPKLRQLTLPSRRRILLSDTVGFVRDLPPALVTSFRATLEEVERAAVLVHVRDAASESLEAQGEQVLTVLRELGVAATPRVDVLNKVDLLPAEEPLPASGVPVSGLRGTGLEAVLQRIDETLTADPLETAEFRIPQTEGRTLAALERGATIESQRFEGNLVYLRATGPTSLFGRYRRFELRER